MRKRWIGYAAWLLLAACLYFFENNTGTRVVLLCSAVFPLIPPLREAFFSPDGAMKPRAESRRAAGTPARREPEEAGDIRPYVPGDPVRRIHWKLSAKKDDLLVRGTAAGEETAEAETTDGKTAEGETADGKTAEAEPADRERPAVRPAGNPGKRPANRPAAVMAACLLLCAALLLLIPEANRGAQALCNRLFAASEAVNAYAYRYFPVPEGQNVVPAAVLLLCAGGLALALAAASRSRLPALGIMAACTLFQVYFGLAFPAWVNIPLCGLLAARMLRQPFRRGDLAVFCAGVLLASALTALFLPGADAATEAASERARDRLARLAEQVMGTVREDPGGETETRHIHTRSMETGSQPAETEREFRLVTLEEKQVSMPRWINWVKVILLAAAAVALVTLPFAPFALLNARKKKAREIRKAFVSPDAGEAVRAVFRQVILWLEATGHGAGNLLYREWAARLPSGLPADYAERFARCAADCEEAAYSDHAMTEDQRRNALDLLRETEAALWKGATRKQRFILKYWMCLCE